MLNTVPHDDVSFLLFKLNLIQDKINKLLGEIQ